jgi:hypothetical protein
MVPSTYRCVVSCVLVDSYDLALIGLMVNADLLRLFKPFIDSKPSRRINANDFADILTVCLHCFAFSP